MCLFDQFDFTIRKDIIIRTFCLIANGQGRLTLRSQLIIGMEATL